jgi:hypothetical protein
MSTSATMPTTTICPQRCRHNNELEAVRINRLRRIDHRAAIHHLAAVRRREVVMKELVQSRAAPNLAERNYRGPNHREEIHVDQNRGPSDATSPVLNANHPLSATSLPLAHRAMPAMIGPASGVDLVRRAKNVRLNPNRGAQNNHVANGPVQNLAAANNRIGRSVQLLPARQANALPLNVLLLQHVPSEAKLHRVNVVQSRLRKSQSLKSPPLGLPLQNQPASPRKNSPRRRPVLHNRRSPVWV